MSERDQHIPLSGNDPQGPPQLNMANCCCNCRCRGLGGSDEGDTGGDNDADKSFLGGSEGIERPPSALSHHIFSTGLCPSCEEDHGRLGRYGAIRHGLQGFEYVCGLSDEAVSQIGRREPAVEDVSKVRDTMGIPGGSGMESRIVGGRTDSGSDVLRGAGDWTSAPPPNNGQYYFLPSSPPLTLAPCMRLPAAMLMGQLEGMDFTTPSQYPPEIDSDDCDCD